MSLRAVWWAIEDPRAASLPASTLRVLMALADHAHDDGTAAWASASTLSRRLTLPERTVERGLARLRAAALIRYGDQALVAHIRADRRSVVWDLDVPARPGAAAPRPPGGGLRAVTDDGPRRAVTDDGARPHGPSRSAPRAVTAGAYGPSPGGGENPEKNHQKPARARGVTTAARGATADGTCRSCWTPHDGGSPCAHGVPAPDLRALAAALATDASADDEQAVGS